MSRLLRAALAAAAWGVPLAVLAFYVAAGVLELSAGVPFAPASGAFRFAWPWAAAGLLLAPAAWLAHGRAEAIAVPRLRVSTLAPVHGGPRGWRLPLRHAPAGARGAALALLTVALMRPQSVYVLEPDEQEGIDIVMVLDLSRSMGAPDIAPTRFDAMVAVVDDFVARRRGDRVGVVVFGREAFTLLPLTTDTEAVRSTVGQLRLGAIDGQGTAIGNALGTALNRLRHTKAKSKVVVLLTDGENNAGNLTPEQATAAAEALGVRVYTVLMGRRESGRIRSGLDRMGRPIWERGNFPVNPALLQRMARRTGGRFFHAADRAGLERSLHAILDQLEKTRFQAPERFYGELYAPFGIAALLLLLLEWGAALWLRRWR